MLVAAAGGQVSPLRGVAEPEVGGPGGFGAVGPVWWNEAAMRAAGAVRSGEFPGSESSRLGSLLAEGVGSLGGL